MKTRNEMIEQLIEADLNSSDTEHLYYVLRDGFVGYRNQTDAELLAELEARGLDGQSSREIALAEAFASLIHRDFLTDEGDTK
jgi:hypothetical protein